MAMRSNSTTTANRKNALILLVVSVIELACAIGMGFLSIPGWGMVDRSFPLGIGLTVLFFCASLLCLVGAVKKGRAR